MPNYITNKIFVFGKDENKQNFFNRVITKGMGGEVNCFDFSKIIPDKYHCADYHRDIWGTKWNTYDNKDNNISEYQFETAWNCPYKVIEFLSNENNNIDFLWFYADEDTGYNMGIYILYKNTLHYLNLVEVIDSELRKTRISSVIQGEEYYFDNVGDGNEIKISKGYVENTFKYLFKLARQTVGDCKAFRK